jgi:hypothetical protein
VQPLRRNQAFQPIRDVLTHGNHRIGLAQRMLPPPDMRQHIRNSRQRQRTAYRSEPRNQIGRQRRPGLPAIRDAVAM